MAIFTRVEWDNFPGAITIAELPFFCFLHPTIDSLGKALMSTPESKPSTIVGGIIYTEATKQHVEDIVCGNL